MDGLDNECPQIAPAPQLAFDAAGALPPVPHQNAAKKRWRRSCRVICLSQHFIREVQERIRAKLSLLQSSLVYLQSRRLEASSDCEAATAAVLEGGLSLAVELEQSRGFQNIQRGCKTLGQSLVSVFEDNKTPAQRVASVADVLRAAGQIKTGLRQQVTDVPGQREEKQPMLSSSDEGNLGDVMDFGETVMQESSSVVSGPSPVSGGEMVEVATDVAVQQWDLILDKIISVTELAGQVLV